MSGGEIPLYAAAAALSLSLSLSPGLTSPRSSDGGGGGLLVVVGDFGRRRRRRKGPFWQRLSCTSATDVLIRLLVLCCRSLLSHCHNRGWADWQAGKNRRAGRGKSIVTEECSLLKMTEMQKGLNETSVHQQRQWGRRRGPRCTDSAETIRGSFKTISLFAAALAAKLINSIVRFKTI